MKSIKIVVLILQVLILACNSKKAAESDKSPEAVVREWQHYIDNNEFQKAMTLSSDVTKHWLENVGGSFEGDSNRVETKFISLSCKEAGETALCKCRIQQEETDEAYEDIFKLVKINGQWLVDSDDFDHESEGEMLENSGLPNKTEPIKE
ncbi:MAG: hypothetical protein ACOYOA_00190 [Saprospiraceae bacterium]